jgi:hypothetical protein
MARPAPAPFLRTPWAAFAGVIVGAPAAALTQQLLSDVLYFDCRNGGSGLGLVVVVATGLLTLGGGLVSWAARRAADQDQEPGARRFLAEVGAGSAGIFLLAILAMGLASLIVPSCHR